MMRDNPPATGKFKLDGKWLVILILAAGVILAVVGSHFTKWRTLMPEPETRPSAS